MAYNSSERFSAPPRYYTILDPGAYQRDFTKIKPNKVPFLSKTPRNTYCGGKIWTHTIYNADLPPRILNCTSMKEKQPRFPYESFSKEDLEEILCRCGIPNPCNCPTGEEEESAEDENFVCQAKVRKRIFKGPPPRTDTGGLSTPPNRDQVKNDSPPFYDATVNEFTSFYNGCKWSRWTSKRSVKSSEVRPGPADYKLENEPTKDQICNEEVRAYKRKTSRQLRFIEMVQQRNILEARPGPATYSPMLPKGTELNYLGPKADRFSLSKYDERPGPADYGVKREFDLPNPPVIPCHAKLPEPSCFGVKAQRFKLQKEEGPSPASYCPNYLPCHFMHCPNAPFGSSTLRFNEKYTDEDDEEDGETEVFQESKSDFDDQCPNPSWEFKSKTIRMKALVKEFDKPSPADLPQPNVKVKRSYLLQYKAPFHTSEGRFQPWYDWMPVFARVKTPGPCYYNLEPPKCIPAVNRGPLVRTARFPETRFQTPAPNEYQVEGGIETILDTHNQKLKNNMENQHKFYWTQPKPLKKPSIDDKISNLLQKSIELLDVDDIFSSLPSDAKKDKFDKGGSRKRGKTKLLKCFLYNTQIPPYF